MRTKYRALGLALVWATSALASGGNFGGGTGSEALPYLIEDMADLQQVSMTVTANAAKSTSASYRLANDIDASGSASKSIGYGVGSFLGKFHGGGFKITGLNMNVGGDYVGLFSTIGANGFVDSLTLVSPKIIGYSAVGAIAGRNDGTIKDCKVINGSVGSSYYGDKLGGIAGANSGTIQGITASDTVYVINLSSQTGIGGIVGVGLANGLIRDVSYSGKVVGSYSVGGIVGELDAGAGSVINAVVQGTVSSWVSNVGGIVGYNNAGANALIDSTKNFAQVAAGNQTAGGIVGWSHAGKIAHSTNTGIVTAIIYVGGIVGSNGDNAVSKPVGANLIANRNTGVVVATGTLYDQSAAICGGLVPCTSAQQWLKDRFGLSFAGGIAGINVSGNIDSSYNTGAVSGAQGIGGIVGYGNYGGVIRNSYNSGMVTASSAYGGGIVGAWFGAATNSGARDSIVNCYNSGWIGGTGTYLGGVVGHGNWGGASYVAMRNSYSVGFVANTTNSGGLIGTVNNSNNNVIVTNSYWDMQTSQWATSANGVSLGSMTGEATSDMFKGIATTYYNWDNAGIWKFSPDSSIYPGFRFMDNAPFAFSDTIETPLQDYAPINFVKNDSDIETGRANLVVKVISVVGGTVSGDSSSTLSFPNTALNRDSMVVVYCVGEKRASDTLWGNQAKATLYFIAPWRSTYYALYSGRNLTKDSLPVLSNLITGKTPAIKALMNPYPGIDSTVGGVAWAAAGQEKFASNGFAYVDPFDYVNTKASSHIVAHIKPRIFYGGDTINTLLTEGFMQTTGSYPSIRVSYKSGKLQLELMSFNTSGGTVSGASAYYDVASRDLDSKSLFNGSWIPVHVIVRKQSAGSNVGVVDLYLGNSADSAKSSHLSLTFNPTYFQLTSTYAKRVVQIPQYETNVNRSGTEVDNNLTSFNPSRKGFGGAWVGDFAMIASESMTRRDLVTSYLSGWKHAGSGTADSASYVAETSMPYITQILYAAPGDQSTASYTSNTSKTSTVQFSAGLNMSADLYAGFEVEPELLTGECGGELHVGVHTSMSMNTTNSFTTTTNSYSGVATNFTKGDIVVANVIKAKNHLYERPRMPYLFTPNPTNAQMIYFIATAPESTNNAEEIQSAREFLNKYRLNPSVMRNFASLYAKDTATGLVRKELITSGDVKKRNEFILEGNVTKSFGDQVTSEKSASQSFDAELGTFMDFKMQDGGAVVGGSISFNVTRSQETSGTNSNSFQTDVSFNDDDSWDQHDVIVYNDLRWGVPIYEMQKDLSFTSGPNEPLSQSTTNIGLGITERTDTNCVGDTIEATLTVANNSSTYIKNSLIDSMQIEVDPTPNFSGVYQKMVIQPAQFMLARGQSQTVKIRYKALDTTSIPISFYINDGYLENGNFNYLENSTIVGLKTVGACPLSSSSSSSSDAGGSSSSSSSSDGGSVVKGSIAQAPSLVVKGFHGGLTLQNLAGNELVTDTKGHEIFRAASPMQSKMLALRPGVYLVKAKGNSYNVLVW